MCLVHSAVPGLSNESIEDDLALAVFSVLWRHAEQHQHSDAVQGLCVPSGTNRAKAEAWFPHQYGNHC